MLPMEQVKATLDDDHLDFMACRYCLDYLQVYDSCKLPSMRKAEVPSNGGRPCQESSLLLRIKLSDAGSRQRQHETQ